MRVSVHVFASVWLREYDFSSLCASVASTPCTLLAVADVIVVYSFGILYPFPMIFINLFLCVWEVFDVMWPRRFKNVAVALLF